MRVIHCVVSGRFEYIFFHYMMEHFAIDLLQEYGTEKLPDTERVVNPAWRALDRSRNSIQNKLRHRRARFAEMTMHPEPEDNAAKFEKWMTRKAELLELIEQYEPELDGLKMKLKKEPKHITWEELDEKDKFFRLLPGRKRLTDTVKMISYRAETAMAGLLQMQHFHNFSMSSTQPKSAILAPICV